MAAIRRNFKYYAKAYGGSLIGTFVALPIFASAVTVCFYIAPPHFSFLWLNLDKSNWYAPVYGFLGSCVFLLFFAALRLPFATVKGANAYVYGMLMRYYSELQGRLSELPNNLDVKPQLPVEVLEAFNVPIVPTNEDDHYRLAVLREAHKAYYDLTRHLGEDAGIMWELGTGYIHAWRMIHRIQEALIEVETEQEVMGHIIHDVRAIRNSKLEDGDTLVEQMLQAVKELSPGTLAFFEDLKFDRKFAHLFEENTSCQNSRQPQPQIARQIVRRAKHALNTYQDSLWSTLIRARNYLSASIALTGSVTHLLLCFAILLANSTNTIVAATAYYMIGVISGLFGRFYNEANIENAPDDYGLFLSRLIATPLLSGLAAIGGVFLATTIGKTPPDLNSIFQIPLSIEYVIAAAVFGFAPNLIVTSFQLRTQKYATDLQSSKGEASKP